MARKSRKQAVAAPIREERPAAKTWKCAVYARLSCKNNGNADAGSLRAQVAFIQDTLAGREDVEVVGVYADNGRTGTTFEGRYEFDRLMDGVRCGDINCIAVKDLSRFGRNMYETSTYLERIFPFLGVRFIAINDGLDTLQGDGGIVVPFKGLVNELYAVETSRKVGMVKRRQMAEGLTTYGIACYGYCVDHQEHRLVVDDETAPFVPLAFSMYLEGERLCDIADVLTEMGAPTPCEHVGNQKQSSAEYWRDVPWEARYVAKMLDNPVYIGTFVAGKTHQSFCDGIERYVTSDEERLVFGNAHDALVPQDVFERVQEIRTQAKSLLRGRVEALQEKRDRMPDLFRGMLFCSECGRRMILDRRFNPKSGETRGNVYKCRKHHGRGCESGVRIPERVVRITVMDVIRSQLAMGLELGALLPGLRSDEDVATERKRLEEAIVSAQHRADKLARKRQTIYECYAEGVIQLDDYRRAQKEDGLEADECERRLKQARDNLADFEAALSSDDGFDEAVSALEDLFTFSRELLEAMVSRVEVSRDGSLDVELRFADRSDRLREIERRLP